MLEKLSQKLIGARVRVARERKGWTQEQLAQGLGLNDRQSISDIENGRRSLKSDELLTLSDLLELDIEFFLDPFAVIGEAQFSWRAASEIAENTLDTFELKTGQWIGLLRWLRKQQNKQASALKPTLRLSAKSSYEDAQACAESLVAELELGVIPARLLIDKIEDKLEIPVLFVDMVGAKNGQSISGATCHLDEMGVILINRNESESRRYFDLAHELFHALTWNVMKPEHRESNSIEDRNNNKSKRIEQLANIFASELLMPLASLNKLIDKTRCQDTKHLCEVAAQLRVSYEALGWRLFKLQLINDDVRQKLSKQKQSKLISDIPKPFSYQFVKMLHEALEKGRLSARKAAKVMAMGLNDLTRLFAEYNLKAPFEL